jgi:phospholipid-binding lipoprotein MlaA
MSAAPYDRGLRQVQKVMMFGGVAAVAVTAVCLCGATATAGAERSVVAENGARVENYSPASDQPDGDPLAGFNEKMFWFNLKLDHYVLRPVAGAYASVAPVPVRQSVGRFFDNADVLPRVTNSVFQLRFKQAGSETARFAINTTLGGIGLFDVADRWFGLSEESNDFRLTLRRYHGIDR